MSDTTTSQYKLAITLGVPDGMARGFYSDLKLYKEHVKNQQTALALMNLNGGGRFIPSN